MGLIEEFKARAEGVCATCDHLCQLTDGGLLACEVHDKFILPTHPPFHGNHKCKNWVRRKIHDELREDQGHEP